MSILVLVVLWAMLVFAPTTPSKSYPIAKPNCDDHCGNVRIPFPFGLTPDCSLNSDFFITCTTSTDGSPKPFLGNGNVEVRKISVEGQLSVKNYVARWCYTKGEIRPRLNIEVYKSGSFKLYVNQTANKFVAVGCDTFAYVYGYGDDRSYKTEGCMASCYSIQGVRDGSCSGIGCCETGIPNVARNVYISVDSINYYRNTNYDINPCSYALVVQKEEFNFSSTMLTTNWDVENAPMMMVLDWTISNQTCITACLGNTTCVLINGTVNSEGYRCACKEGYEGNPYLLSGCQDIDECEHGKNNCSKNAICSNTEGGYKCSCKKGFHGDAKGDFGCTSSNRLILIMLVLGIASGTTILSIIVFCLYLGYLRRKSILMKDKFFRENGGLILKQNIADHGSASSGTPRMFTAEELKGATKNYDETRIIGRGGFGIVYKGDLDGQIVAIKKANMMDLDQRVAVKKAKTMDPFINEIIVLSQTNHKNIVKLLGCCLETKVPLLVYEFIDNGTLCDHLYNKDKASTIPWSTRLRIATETAEVLSYLHSAASPPIIHRDIKSANILLDKHYTAKVSDFGASRLVLQDQNQISTVVEGTFGYLDPEYVTEGFQFTEKSDVYSFGVVLVELLTGMSAIYYDRDLPMERKNLSKLFLSLLKTNQLHSILDNNLVYEGSTLEELQEVALLAKRCLKIEGEDRPMMKEVAIELNGLRRASKHSWANNSEDSIESQPLLTEPPILHEYYATLSITSEYDSLTVRLE